MKTFLEIQKVVDHDCGNYTIGEIDFVNHDAIREYINQHVIKYEDTLHSLLDAFLTVATDPEHPYNADFLHRRLMKDELAERDMWWSLFLVGQCGEKGAVDRIIDWAWSEHDRSYIDDESIPIISLQKGENLLFNATHFRG